MPNDNPNTNPNTPAPAAPAGIAKNADAVPGTDASLVSPAAAWDAIIPTLTNPQGIADFEQDKPADMPIPMSA